MIKLPVAQQGTQDHQAVLHQSDNFSGLRPFEQELPFPLKRCKTQVLVGPVLNHLRQLGFDILLLNGRYADILQGRGESHGVLSCNSRAPEKITALVAAKGPEAAFAQ